MEKTNFGNAVDTKIEDETSLKNTLASVFLMGFFLIAAWVGIYFLFLQSF